MNNTDPQTPEGRALLEWAKEHLPRPELLTLERGDQGKAAVVAVPEGFELKSLKPMLDEYLPVPERIRGTAKLCQVKSFCEHILRFRTPATAVFATPTQLTAVYNYHGLGAPAHCDHRALFTFPRSSLWQAWKAIDGKSLDQRAFAEWLEGHAGDVLGASGETSAHGRLLALGLTIGAQAEVVGLAKGLSIRVESEVADTQTLATGAVKIGYSTEVKGEKGEPLMVPAGFVVLIPVLDGDAAYPLAVRLRFRLENQRVKWSMHLLGADDVERDAIERAIADVTAATGVPLFYGSPE